MHIYLFRCHGSHISYITSSLELICNDWILFGIRLQYGWFLRCRGHIMVYQYSVQKVQNDSKDAAVAYKLPTIIGCCQIRFLMKKCFEMLCKASVQMLVSMQTWEAVINQHVCALCIFKLFFNYLYFTYIYIYHTYILSHTFIFLHTVTCKHNDIILHQLCSLH